MSVNKCCYTEFDMRTNLCCSIEDLDLSGIREQARSVACLMETKCLDHCNQLMGEPTVKTLGTRFKLAEGERFKNEPSCALGTAFLIGDKEGTQLALTAGHNVCDKTGALKKVEDIRKLCLLFDFIMLSCEECSQDKTNKWNRDFSQTTYRFTVLAYKYSRPLKVSYGEKEDLRTWEDWAILKLDRAVEGRNPMKLNFHDKINLYDKIFTLGFPCGSPQKFTRNGEVVEQKHIKYFKSNLDAFEGNSGSPVCLFDTHEVVGIFISGAIRDFDKRDDDIYSVHHTSKQGTERSYKITALTFLQATLSSINISMPTNFLGKISLGLNVEGKCTTNGCPAFNQIVFVHRGIGFFNMNAVCCETECPSCHQLIDYDDINRMVLSSCGYKMDAMNIHKQRIIEELRVGKGQEYNFDISQWKYMELEVTK